MNVNKLVKLRKKPIVGKYIKKIIMLFGVCIEDTTEIGNNVDFVHNSVGTVLHSYSVIEDNVKIYQGVTLGRADIYTNNSKFEGILIKDGAILCAGAKILCKNGLLTVGKNTIIGANAVLLCSTGDNEIWAGNPAKLIRKRDDIN